MTKRPKKQNKKQRDKADRDINEALEPSPPNPRLVAIEDCVVHRGISSHTKRKLRLDELDAES